MKINYFGCAIAALFSLFVVGASAQTLVDDFNRANNNTVGGGGGGWTETETTAGTGCVISSNQVIMSSTTTGRDFIAQTTPGTYNTTLSSNTCVLTWAFNMRQTRGNPSGFGNNNYGIGAVLAGSNNDLSSGTGYAVVLGNSGNSDPIRLIRYTNGLDGTLNNIISASDFGNNYLDVRVTYDPSTDTWELFYSNQGSTGPFGDPTLAATSAGTAVDATYTGSAHGAIGCYWNHATGGTESGRFDNFYVPNDCTPPYPTPPGSGDALDFDGSNDYVHGGTDPSLSYEYNEAFSAEAWVKTTSTVAAIVGRLNQGTGLVGWEIGTTTAGRPVFYLVSFYGNPNEHLSVQGGNAINDGEWHHLACTYDGSGNFSGVSIYLDGVMQTTSGYFSSSTSVTTSTIPAAGTIFSIGRRNGATNLLSGNIDEVRVWGAELTQAEVRDHMCQKDLSAHPEIANLDVHYRMDDGTGSSTLADISGNGWDGTLTFMDPNTDWVTSAVPLGDESSQGYGVSTLTHTSGTSFTADTYTGAPDGVHVYKVNEAPNNVTVPGTYTALETSEYYGVHLVGGTAPTYTATLGYTSNTNINGQSNEPGARLSNRAHNADGAFADIATQTLNTAANTIVAPGQTGTEFLPGFIVVPEVQFEAPVTNTEAETAGTTDIILEIANASAILAPSVDVVLLSGDATRINNYTTQTVNWAASDATDKSLTITITDNILCDGPEVLVFELQNAGGSSIGTNTQFTLTITDGDVCPVLEVASPITATVAESAGTTDITLEITNPSVTLTSAVDVVLLSGSAARINGYTTQTVNWAANDGTDKTVTITMTDDPACNGDEVLVFELQNPAGTSGATVGASDQFTLTVTDNQTLAGQTLALQGFESSAADTWGITSGGGATSTAVGGGDFPSNERILNGSNSFQTNNTTNTMDYASVNVAGSAGLSITARLSSTAGSSGNGADGADEVEVYVNIDGAGFPGTPDLTVSGNSNAKWGYSTGTGVASATAGTPASFAPAGGGNRTTDGYSFLQVDVPDGATTVALRITAMNNSGNETWNIEDVQLSGSVCQEIYYSQASGDVTDPIWDLVTSGTGAAATFNQYTSMVVQAGDDVNQDVTSLDVDDFTLESGGSYTSDNSTDVLNVFHNTDIDDTDFGPLVLDWERTDAVAAATGVAITVTDANCNGAGVDFNNDSLTVNSELNINNGTFDANDKPIILVSDINGTALIGDLSNGTLTAATNVSMQRYIPEGVTNWRNLASPVTGTLEDWDADFITSGIPNSDHPNFLLDGVVWPNIYLYDETSVMTPLIDEGFVAPTDMNNAYVQGAGYWVWCGDSLSGTDPFTIDATGTVGIGPVNITLDNSITGTSTVPEIAELGWNMVGNPLPAPVDFGAFTLTGNIADQYWIYDPVTGNTAFWDEFTSTSIPSLVLNGSIQSSQAFWVHCNAQSPSDIITIDEDAKVSDAAANGLFGGMDQQNNALSLRLKVESNMNSFYDEVLVRFSDDGAPGHDANDAYKMFYNYSTAPMISTENTDGHKLILNDMGPLVGGIAVPVYIKVGQNGTYTINVHEAANLMEYSCLILEDLMTGTSTTLTEGATYSFNANLNDPDTPRFLIHMSAPITNEVSGITCHGQENGEAIAEGSGVGPWSYTWYDNGGNVLLNETLNGASQLENMAAGEYSVEVSSDAGCGNLINFFEIEEPNVMDAQFQTGEAICSQSGDGNIDLQPMGGTEPLNFEWSNGEVSEDLNDLNAGLYHVVITDANNCVFDVNDIEVTAEQELIATIGASATEVLVNEAVAFNNNSIGGTDLLWSFGDGDTSIDNDPFHSYALPGIYEVTLALSEDDCNSTDLVEIEVSTSVGITDLDNGDKVELLQNGELVQLFFELSTTKKVEVQLFDLVGNVLHQLDRSSMTNGSIDLHLEGFAQGVYLINVQVDGSAQSFKVIKR